MKAIFTYKQVQDALAAGYTSPLNHCRKADDVAIMVTGSRGVPSFEAIEGTWVPVDMIQAAFINAKTNNENSFATICYEIAVNNIVISASVSLCQNADYDLIENINHRIEEEKRHNQL